MKPSDFPTGRTIPGEDNQVIIDMSMDEPEEAGANARSPSPTPDYENVEEAEVLMEEAEAEKNEARSPIYKAPGSRSPSRERSPVRPVLKAYYTQNFRPKQVFGPRPVLQVTQATLQERRKRLAAKVAQDQKRGRQREQDPKSRVPERQGPGPSRSRSRAQRGTRDVGARWQPEIGRPGCGARIGFVIATSVKLFQGEKRVRS